ncbi:MAG: ATP synthase F0 subunit B [Desulfobaccales bacterium]|jgi:F-type H+-transporting ATPase subunit b
MIQIDWSVGAQLVTFLVLVFLLNMVLFRPIREALKARQARMDAQKSDIDFMETTGQGVDRETKDKLAAARREGVEARESLKQKGSEAEAALLEEIKREVNQEWSQVEERIKSDVARARKSLQTQTQSFAQSLASKILGRELS